MNIEHLPLAIWNVIQSLNKEITKSYKLIPNDKGFFNLQSKIFDSFIFEIISIDSNKINVRYKPYNEDSAGTGGTTITFDDLEKTLLFWMKLVDSYKVLNLPIHDKFDELYRKEVVIDFEVSEELPDEPMTSNDQDNLLNFLYFLEIGLINYNNTIKGNEEIMVPLIEEIKEIENGIGANTAKQNHEIVIGLLAKIRKNATPVYKWLKGEFKSFLFKKAAEGAMNEISNIIGFYLHHQTHIQNFGENLLT